MAYYHFRIELSLFVSLADMAIYGNRDMILALDACAGNDC